MAIYYVNHTPEDNGDYEVHHETCYWLTLISRKKYLGEHATCQAAVTEAKNTYEQSNGCQTCLNECHIT